MSVFPQMTKLGGIALGFLFPEQCVGCGRQGELLCRKCRRALSRIVSPLCPRCGRTQMNGVLCPSCIASKGDIDGVRSPFRFEGVARQAVHQFKYRNIRSLAVPLAELMWDYFLANPIPGDTLIPVPLHSKRLRERGYNQSQLLAAALGKLSGMPVLNGGLIRQKYTPPQARTSSVEERRHNIAGAFACPASSSGTLHGRSVILIDDVATSTATVEACAAALKAAGALSVWGFVFAREM